MSNNMLSQEKIKSILMSSKNITLLLYTVTSSRRDLVLSSFMFITFLVKVYAVTI